MVRVTIHSRAGNRVLEVAGAIYALMGIVLFGWFVVDSWGAASLIDRGLQFLLVTAIILGLWFIHIGHVNLTTHDVSSRQHARQHRANAAVTT